MYLQTVQSSFNSEDSLHSADEAGDRSAWAGGGGQEFDPDSGYCSHSTSSSSYNIEQATEVSQGLGSVFKKYYMWLRRFQNYYYLLLGLKSIKINTPYPILI